MARLLAYTMIGLATLLVMLAGAATAIGRGMPTDAATIAANPVRNMLSDEMVFRLVDLNRLVSAPIPVPIHNVRDVMLNPDGQSALLLTRSVATEYSAYGLYFFHILTGEVQTLHYFETAARDSNVYRMSNIYSDFSISLSPDGKKIAMVDPVEQSVNVFDVESGTQTHLQDLQFSAQFLFLNWSPDGTQIVYREVYNALAVAHVDGTNVRQFDNLGAGTPVWSPDGRWLMMVPSGNEQVGHIRVIDPVTGDPHPHVRTFEASSPAWSCNSQWLSYLLSLRQVNLLNLETGETVNPHETSLLSRFRVRNTYWLQDCTRMIITGFYIPSRQSSEALYLLDTQTMDITLLTDDGGELRGIFEDEMLYTKVDSSSPNPSLIRLNMETLDTEYVGELPAGSIWVRLVDRSRSLYVEPDTRQVILLDFDRGTTTNLLPEGEVMFNLVIWQTG